MLLELQKRTKSIRTKSIRTTSEREPTGDKVEEKSKYRKAYTLEWDCGAILARVARVAHAFLAVQVPPLAMHFMMMTSCGESRSLCLQALHCARVSLLLGRRLALVVTGGVGLDKGRDPYHGISTRNRPFSFFSFWENTKTFPNGNF